MIQAPQIEHLGSKILVGIPLEMSLLENKTQELFRSFMPRRKEIPLAITDYLYDLRVYPEDYHENFHPTHTFTKWALVAVTELGELPQGMQSFHLKGGKYAVFTHQGPPKPSIFSYIFSQWLPQSGYQLDQRPHFDILEENARMNPKQAQEEYWIPLK